MSCLICSSPVDIILDLGEQSFANALLASHDAPSPKYPLELSRCTKCAHLQISYHADPSLLFSTYPWVTGTSLAAQTFSNVLCQEILDRHYQNTEQRPLVVEVASNDGTFLKPFLKRNCQVIGFEPAKNIAEIAAKENIPTEVEFFTATSVEKVLSTNEEGADVVIARNVVPHTPEPVKMLKNISNLLSKSGLAYVEFHDSSSILEGLQYDSIYHEHYSYFSLATLSFAASIVGLKAIDVIHSPISGGALVVVLTKNNNQLPSADLEAKQRSDDGLGLHLLSTWQSFATAASRHSSSTFKIVSDEIDRGRVIHAFGSSARSNTFLAYSGLDFSIITSIFDNNQLKQGSFTPGTRIPIVAPNFKTLSPKSTLLLCAWNFASEIEAQLLNNSQAGLRLIKPFPGDPICYSLE